jgi:hypothetical protein
MSNFTTAGGFECPKGTSKLAKRVLRRLRRRGTVIFECDDGPSIMVRDELIEIAGAVGIMHFPTSHRVVLVDEGQTKTIDGSKASEKACKSKVAVVEHGKPVPKRRPKARK